MKMGKIKQFQNFKMYKFLSIMGFLECVLIPTYLTHIYLIENPNLRPDGTILMLVVISLFGFPLNALLTACLFLESKLNKNFSDIKRHILTGIGFYIFLGISIIGFFTFLFSIFLILV